MRPFTAFEQKNLKFLVNHNVKFTQVEITPTGLGKGILDSTAPMRAYFLENKIHNYEEQLSVSTWRYRKTAPRCKVRGRLRLSAGLTVPLHNKQYIRQGCV